MKIKKLQLFATLLLFFAFVGVQTASADNIVVGGKTYTLFTGFTTVSGQTHSNTPQDQRYDKLVDGDKNTKWFCKATFNDYSDSKVWIEFSYTKAFIPKGYYLTTGSDIDENTKHRNPKSWILKGKMRSSDAEWTTLATVTNDSTLPATNTTDVRYDLTVNTSAYQYFRFEIKDVQGKEGSKYYMELSEFQFFGEEIDNNLKYATITGVQPAYDVTGNPIHVNYSVTAYKGSTALTKGTHYSEEFTPSVPTNAGTYTLTINGIEPYFGSQSVIFRVVAPLSGDGSSTNPYLINNTAEWAYFAEQINAGNADYTSAYIKLSDTFNNSTDPITADLMVGTSSNKFKGVFDGNGKTLYLNLSATEDYCAPFRYVQGATIKNLKVDGSITSSGRYAACFIAYNMSSGSSQTQLINCQSTVTLTSTNASNAFNAGFVAYSMDSMSFTDCIFKGGMLGNQAKRNAGFVTTDRNNTFVFNNCLFYATELDLYTFWPFVYTDWASSSTKAPAATLDFTNTYYVNLYRNTQGTRVFTTQKDNTEPVVAADGETYYKLNYVPDGMWAKFTNEDDVDYLYTFVPKSGQQGINLEKMAGTVSSFKVFDYGYTEHLSNSNGYLLLTAPTGYVLQVTGNTKLSQGEDKLQIFDGASADESKRFGSWSSVTSIGEHTTTGNQMLIYFYVNNHTEEGFELEVTLINTATKHSITINTDPNSHGYVTGPDPLEAAVNETVTLTAHAADNYLINELTVVDESSNNVPVEGGWFTDNVATFTMPSRAVTVTPVFALKANDLYVKMPSKSTSQAPKTAKIPVGVQSFKIYDDGGANADHSLGCDGYLLLTAPENCVLEISGSVSADDAKLTIYNSDGTTKLLEDFSKTGSGTSSDIGTLRSSGRTMTLHFKNYNYNTSYARGGINLTATVISTIETYGISVNNPQTGGSVASSVETASVNAEITLTATPDTEHGYMLRDISVVGKTTNTPVVVSGGWYTNNVATFTMPGEAVSVTPSFTQKFTAEDGGLFINMPATGTATAAIPAAVESFKIYDDGGADNPSSINCDGYLQLTVPESYVIQLSGTISADGNDKLFVWKGNTASWETLLLEQGGGSDNYQIRTLVSPDNQMLMQFTTKTKTTRSGLNLTAAVGHSVSLVNPNSSYGTLAADKNFVTKGSDERVTLTLTPSAGYSVDEVKYIYGGNEYVIEPQEGVYAFSMPDANVSVSAKFKSNDQITLTGQSATVEGVTKYWTTFYYWPNSQEDVYQLPAGAQVFIMKSDFKLYLVGDGTIVPPYQGVVIISDNAEITLSRVAKQTVSTDGNILRGVSNAVDDINKFMTEHYYEEIYVLGIENNTLGLYKYYGPGLSIPANKAYYPVLRSN